MYVAADPESRALMPFGLRGKPGEANFDLFQEALMEALGLAQGQGQGTGTSDCASSAQTAVVSGGVRVFVGCVA